MEAPVEEFEEFQEETEPLLDCPYPMKEAEIREVCQNLSDPTRVSACLKNIYTGGSHFLSNPMVWRELPGPDGKQDPPGILYPVALSRICVAVRSPEFVRSISFGVARMVPDHKANPIWRDTVVVLITSLSVLMETVDHLVELPTQGNK